MATKAELKGKTFVRAKLGTKLPYKIVALLGVRGTQAHISWKVRGSAVDAHIHIKWLKVIKKSRKVRK